MQLPYTTVFQFYEGADEGQFSDFTGTTLNSAPNQLIANDVAMAQAISTLETSGSVDSQKLAGIPASFYVRKDLGNILLGNQIFSGRDASGGYSTAPIEILEVLQAGTTKSAKAYAPALTFHWTGTAQLQLALESDGRLRLRDGTTHTSLRDLDVGSLFVNGTNISSLYLGLSAKAADSNLLDGLNSTDFLRSTAKAMDSNLLDGLDSTEFLRSTATATNASKLANKSLQSGSDFSDVIPFISAANTMEIGRRIDFHYADSSDDYDFVIELAGSDVNPYMNFANDVGTSVMRINNDGTVLATGDVSGYYSDERLKEVDSQLVDCLSKILNLDVIRYHANELAVGLSEGVFKADKSEIGLKAGQVEKYFPELVVPAPFDLDEHGGSKSGDNYKTLNYARLTSVLVGAIQEQQEHINSLEEKLETMEEAHESFDRRLLALEP